MLTSSKSTLHPGSTSSEPNPTSTISSHAIYSSRRRQTATSRAPIVPERKSRLIWTLIFLRRLLMKHQGSALDPSVCICSENPCSIHEYLRPYTTSNEAIGAIRFSSQRIERFLIKKWESLLMPDQTLCFGHGGKKLRLTKRPKGGYELGVGSESDSLKKS